MLKKIFIAFVLLCAFSASADRNKSLVDNRIDSVLQSNKVVFIDGRPNTERMIADIDSVRREISTFYYDQFRHSQDPDAPYFLFMSKDSQLAMGIGGAVRMRAYYDWGGAVPSSAFMPYLVPMNPSPETMRNFGTTPSGTCLFFRVLGRNTTLGSYQLYIEANFNGYNGRDFHMKKAYAIINDITVGYASSTFSDPAAVPPTVDAAGPNNKITPTSVLVRYMPVVRDRWHFAISAETPSTAIDVDNHNTAKANNWLPDFAAFAQYQWAPGQHVRLAGIGRTLSYRNLVHGQNHDIIGWGVQLSSVAHPIRHLTTYLTASFGQGYAGLGGDLLTGNYDLVGRPETPGKMYAPKSYGWCIGLQYNFKHNLFMSATISQNRYLPSHRIDPDEYKYGVFSDINVFWNMTPRIQIGAEFDFMFRNNFSGERRYARRIGAMCQFSF